MVHLGKSRHKQWINYKLLQRKDKVQGGTPDSLMIDHITFSPHR